jgi:hypothetical protein
MKYNRTTREWQRHLSMSAAIKKATPLTEDGTVVMKSFKIYIGETDPKNFATVSATIEITLPGSEENMANKLTFTLAGAITKDYHVSMEGTASGDFLFDHFDKAISGKVEECTLTVEASLFGTDDKDSSPFGGLSIDFLGRMTLGDGTIDATVSSHFPQPSGQLDFGLDIIVDRPMILSELLGPGSAIGSFGIDTGRLKLHILFGPEDAQDQISKLDWENGPVESLIEVTKIYMSEVTLTVAASIKLYGIAGHANVLMAYDSSIDKSSISAEIGVTGNVEELFAAIGGGNSDMVDKLSEIIEEVSGGIVYYQPYPHEGKDAEYTIKSLRGFDGEQVGPGMYYMATLKPKTDSTLSAVTNFFNGDNQAATQNVDSNDEAGTIVMQGQIVQLKLISACVEKTLEGILPTAFLEEHSAYEKKNFQKRKRI